MEMQLVFAPKPEPVIPEYRPIYKISQILLILKLSSRGCKSTAARLQLFSWVFKRPSRENLLLDALQSRTLETPVWGFDPAVDLALKIAEAEGLIFRKGKVFSLSGRGDEMAKRLIREVDVLVEEKQLLDAVGKKISQSMVDGAIEAWGAK